MREDIRNRKNEIINGNLITSILSIISIILGMVIILDQKKKANGKEEFLTNEESQRLALLTKLISLFVVLYSLSLDYQSYNLAKVTNQDTSSLRLELVASYLAIVISLINLYVVITNYSNTSFQPAEIENNSLF